jgi:hypothetical protein
MAVALAAVLAAPAAASGGVDADVRTIRAGITAAAKAGRLAPGDAARHRVSVTRALSAWRSLPAARKGNLAGALRDAAAVAGRLDAPRALAVFGGLDTTTQHSRSGSKQTPDVDGPDGAVYRYFSGHGYQFHPLANFARLNGHVVRQDADATRRLADALIARAVTTPSGLAWEYYFPFGGGRAPWTSGMAQAVAAQAFGRASTLLADPTLLEPGSQAFAAARALSRQTTGGPWIRLYSFSSMAVLNAQLQAALSIAEYAAASGNADATLFAESLETSAAALLPAFDTGAWSLYALDGAEATAHYHGYVVTLLRRLAQLDERPEWAEYRDVFEVYEEIPPVVEPVAAIRVVYPVPKDGYLDRATVTFTLDKWSTVRFVVAGERRPYLLRRGRHTLSWDPGLRDPLTYAAKLTATDLAGNTADVQLDPVEVRHDGEPPTIDASIRGRRLVWRAQDEATPWLQLAVVFENGAGRKRVTLGRRPLAGSAPLRVPRGRWGARLVGADSAGNSATVFLGPVAS